MVRGNRIKEYRFTTDSLVSADGTLDVYTSFPLNGLLQTVQWAGGNYTATGSLSLTTSGTGEVIWELTSGLNYAGESFTKFPRASCVTTTNVSLGSNVGDEYAEIPLHNVIRFVGAGLGTGKSGLGLNINYI